MGVYIQYTPRLPSEYQEVEWIGGNNGNSSSPIVYIDTGVVSSNNIGCHTEMLHTSTRDNLRFFENDLPSTTNRWGLVAYPSGKWCPQWETWHQTDVSYNINQFYDIKLNRNNNKLCTIDGITIYTCSSASFTGPSIKIGQITYSGNYGWKLKYFKITDGTTLVRDFIPCYRKSDSVIGMYDLVNNQFYTNSGSGTFSKGSDVTMVEMKNAYIGEVWTPGTDTIGYWKLEDNTDATVGTTQGSNNVTFTTLASGKKVGVFNGSNSMIRCDALATGTNNTYLLRCMKTGNGSGEMIVANLSGGTGKKGTAIRAKTSPFTYLTSQFSAWYNIVGATSNNVWYLIGVTQNSSGSIVYLNGTQVATDSVTGANSNVRAWIGCNDNNPNGQDFFAGYISEVIAEKRTWTATEMSNYFNNTKANYGL